MQGKQMKHIPSRTPQIMFIGPNYYMKHVYVKVNLDPILQHQMKCESMKARKSTQAKHVRGSFYFQIQML